MYFKKSLKIVILSLFLLTASFLHSQMIVRIDKGSMAELNLLESMSLKLCFEMEDFIVVAIDTPDVLRANNIDFILLSQDIKTEPLYIVSANRRETLGEGSFFGEIVIDESYFRVERLSSPLIDVQFQPGVKLIPVRVNERIYRNIRTSLPSPYDSTEASSGTTWEGLLNSVNADSIAYFIQGLEDFETRFAWHPNRFEVSQWIADQFRRFGYTDVEQDTFFAEAWGQGTLQANVIATVRGSVFPDRYVIVGAHHDSINQYGDWMVFAPGSNDNASGVAAVLEIARVMKLHDYQPLSSIRFITFAIEELGLHGAHHDANRIIEEGKNVAAMINSDMISYNASSNWLYSIRNYPGANFLTNLAQQKMAEFSMDSYTTTSMNANSDSWAYHSVGIPAIFFHIGEDDPYYHTSFDVLARQNMPYAELYIKMIADLTMQILGMLDSPEDFTIFDAGTGDALRAAWSGIDLDGVIYRLTVRNTENQESETYYTAENFLDIEFLSEGVMYEITLFTTYNNGESQGISRFATPQSIPRAVGDFYQVPELNQISFVWTKNQELDIERYKVYRREFPSGHFLEIASVPSSLSYWTDTTTENRIWYEYKINAVDTDGNQSPDSDIIETRHLNFDNGILVIDLTLNTEHNPLAPPLEAVTDFYQYILEGHDFEEIKYNNTTRIRIEEIGTYATLIVHKNSFNSTRSLELERLFRTIIGYGGNIIFTANDALSYLNNVTIYPREYQIGEFPRDYFKIETVNSNSTAMFAAGVSSGWNNLPNLEIDPSKIPANQNGKLNRMEVYTGSGFEVLYTYASGNADILSAESLPVDADKMSAFPVATSETDFDGLPVAIYTSRTNSHIVLTSIPLYFLKQEAAREFIGVVLHHFDTAVSDDDNPEPIYPERLNIRNYPNPFNPFTTIEFTLSAPDFVEVNIYNIRGQLVKSFPKEMYFVGRNSLQWDGTGISGDTLSSGLYLYQVKTDRGQSEVGRMVLLK